MVYFELLSYYEYIFIFVLVYLIITFTFYMVYIQYTQIPRVYSRIWCFLSVVSRKDLF